MPASFGSGDIDVYLITKDGREVKLAEKNSMSILYNGQPVGGFNFKPWFRVSASSSDGDTFNGDSFSYTATWKIYVNGVIVKSGSKSGTGTIGSSTYPGAYTITADEIEPKIPPGKTGTVKFEITVTVSWKAPNGSTITKSQTFTASVSVYNQPTTYSLTLEGGVSKSTVPVIN